MKDVNIETQKRKEIISKFTSLPLEEQIERYRADSVFHSIIEMLARDRDPYLIIEFLIEDRERLIEEFNAATFPETNQNLQK